MMSKGKQQKQSSPGLPAFWNRWVSPFNGLLKKPYDIPDDLVINIEL